MTRGIIYIVSAVIVIVAVGAVLPSVRQRARQVASDLKIINADTGDVMASATYQRFAARREGIAAMRAALLSVAAAESAFVADSGRPTAGYGCRDGMPSSTTSRTLDRSSKFSAIVG